MNRYRGTEIALVACTFVVLAVAPVSAQDGSRARKSGHGALPGSGLTQVTRTNAVDAFTLAGVASIHTNANQLDCILHTDGNICGPTNPNDESGIWPRGTNDNYMYSAGIRVSGVIRAGATCDPATKIDTMTPTCFAWSGDTTGAWFDALATPNDVTPLTNLYDSNVAADFAAWPTAGSLPDFPLVSAFVTDTTIFNPSLIGHRAASDQDTWMAYWDGGTLTTRARAHPMGILVERRTMSWNLPEGNEATIYYVYKITNITNNVLFQHLSEAKFFGGTNRLPDDGWRLDSVYVAQTADPDVSTNFSANYFTPVPAFAMSMAYEANFSDGSFSYPASVFHLPFLTKSPGIVGLKFLRTPINIVQPVSPNLSMFTDYSDGGIAFAPSTVQAAWRRDALHNSALDPKCQPDDVTARRLRSCFLSQTSYDVFGAMMTGPFSLDPGQTETVIVGVMAAAALANPSAAPGSDVRPGVPSPAPGCNGQPIRPIEVAAGWLASRNCPASPDAFLDGRNVSTVHESLLGKAAVAQALVDNKFAAPSAPVSPAFYVVPLNNRVTVVWDPSPTEAAGDPFFAFAGDPNNGLYDPNYRKLDVEGYRIYRGTTPTNLKLVAQFDKNNSVFTDVLCLTNSAHATGAVCSDTIARPINDSLVQYTSVITDNNGTPQVLTSDTLLANAVRTGRALPLTDSGIPFAYTDSTVRNGFTYFYAVTAFDANSARTGATSQESLPAAQVAYPRASASDLVGASIETGLAGRDGLLSTRSANEAPMLDSLTGEFTGPALPTTGLSGQLDVYAAQLLSAGAHDVRIDSIVPSYYGNGSIATYYLTTDSGVVAARFSGITVNGSPIGIPSETIALPLDLLHADVATRADLNARDVNAASIAGAIRTSLAVDRPLLNSLQADWAFKQPQFWSNDPPLTTWAGGSRWFSGANETMPDPAFGVVAHGQLDGVDAIFQPVPYRGTVNSGNANTATTAIASYRGTNGTTLLENIFRNFYMSTFGVTRAADVRFYWGTPSASGAATLDSVIDVTHDVAVPFSAALRASYGFLPDADGDGKLTYGDFYYLDGVEPVTAIKALALQKKPLLSQPTLQNVDVTGDLIVDGTGFGLYVDGEPYIFQVSSMPANTVWTLRTYNGVVARDTSGVYSFAPVGGNPAVTGLRFVNTVKAPALVVAASADLSKVHTVPDPYYANSLFDEGAATRQLQFVNLPARADVRIYSLSGVLIDVLIHDDPAGGGKETWDLRTRNGKFVASGVYLFHVLTPEGRMAVGKFTVIGPPN